MSEAVRDSVDRQGFAFISEHAPRLSSKEALGQLGTILGLPGLRDVQALEPRDAESATPNTYSGNYGRGVFPLHTDLAHWYLPPRYLALRCLAGTEGVTTRLLDGNEAITAVGKSALERALVQPRRPLENRRALLRLLDSPDGSAQLLRWDRLFIVPVTPAAETTFSRLRAYTDFADTTEISLSKPGDTLVLDNWRMLHGRSAVGSDSTSRRIERAYSDELT